MVSFHHNEFYFFGIWIYQFPGLAGIGASPESVGLRVHHFGIERVEDEKANYAAKVKHPPRLSAVVGDVSSGHVAGHKNCVWIMGADGRIEHRSAAPRAQNLEISGADAECKPCEGEDQNQMLPHFCHLILSFTFDIFASPLSGKVHKLSTAKWQSRSKTCDDEEC